MPQAIDEAGNIWETDAQGNPVRFLGKQGGPSPVTLGRPNTAKVLGDNLSNTKTQLDIDGKRATMDADRRRAEADARTAEINADKAAREAKGDAPDNQKLANLRALENLLNDLTTQYNAGPGVTKGFKGWQDYLPSDVNAQFDTTGSSIGDVGFAAFRVPGSGPQSDADLRNFVNANTPSSGNRDVSIEQKIKNVRNRLNETYKQYGIEPQKSVQIGAQYEGATGKNVIADGDIKKGAIPAAMQAEYTAFLKANPRGSLPPEAYAAKRLELNARYDFGSSPDDYRTYLSEGKAYNEQLNRPFNMTLPAPDMKTSAVEQGFGEAYTNDYSGPPLTALARAGNMGGMGVPQMLAGGEVFDAMKQENPKSAFVGDVAGAMAGTSLLNAAGRNSLGRLTPKLVPNGAFKRGLIGDAAYGSIYGATTEGDPVTGAIAGAAGSALGQGGANVLGGTLKGVTNPAAQYLRSKGVPLTVGQATGGTGWLGNFIKGAEDLTANAGPFGSMVNARRAEGLEGANLAAYNMGANGRGVVTDIGSNGVDQLGLIKEQSYADALNPVSLNPDAQFTTQMRRADMKGRLADTARNRGDFGYIMDNQIQPIAGNAPNINGKQLQDILRTTQGQQRLYSRAATGLAPDPMAMGVSDALGGVNDAVTGLTARQAPDAIPGLKAANAIHRNQLILDDAANSAVDGVFTGKGLNNAVKRNVRGIFGRSSKSMVDKQPLAELAKNMEAVLPNEIPPTGVNAAPTLALLGGAGTLLGGGAGYAGGDVSTGATTGLSLAGLMALASTRQGQKMLVSGLMDRPDAARWLGTQVGKQQGLIGGGTAGLFLGNQ